MNERINQIIEECTEYWADKGDTYFDKEKDTYFDKEKFAELIVKECYLWAKENGGLGCEEDFEALKEHFGVEE
jgi:hypothetical protein